MKKEKNGDITLSYQEIEKFINAVNNNKLDVIMPHLRNVAQSWKDELERAEKLNKKARECKHEWQKIGLIEPYYICCKICGLQYRAFKEGRPRENWKDVWTHTIHL